MIRKIEVGNIRTVRGSWGARNPYPNTRGGVLESPMPVIREHGGHEGIHENGRA